MPDLLLYRCELCGRPQAKNRRVCSRCYKDGKSVRGGICAECGVELGAGSHQRSYCLDCRDLRDKERRRKFYAKRKLSGMQRYWMMKSAEKPLKDDLYAQTHEPISDAEYDAKVERLRALMAADVHVGSYASGRHRALPEAEVGGFGSLANQHMRGAEAGTGRDRVHGYRTQQSQETRAAADSGERVR